MLMSLPPEFSGAGVTVGGISDDADKVAEEEGFISRGAITKLSGLGRGTTLHSVIRLSTAGEGVLRLSDALAEGIGVSGPPAGNP